MFILDEYLLLFCTVKYFLSFYKYRKRKQVMKNNVMLVWLVNEIEIDIGDENASL